VLLAGPLPVFLLQEMFTGLLDLGDLLLVFDLICSILMLMLLGVFCCFFHEYLVLDFVVVVGLGLGSDEFFLEVNELEFESEYFLLVELELGSSYTNHGHNCQIRIIYRYKYN